MQQGTRKAAVISYQKKYEKPSGEGKRGHAKAKGQYRTWQH